MRLSIASGAALLATSKLAGAANSRPYPPPDAYLQSTNILDHASYLEGLDDQQWYLDNIPFIDVPDKSMQEVYYYRTSVIKRHIKWAHEGHGWMVTEFIHPVSWASKFQTIPDSATHHVLDLRWLRDPNYVKNLIESYTRGGVEKLSGITYTHWMQRAIYEHAQATGDIPFLVSQLEGLQASYWLWNVTQNNETGLYHRNPLQDAQEYSLPGYLTGGPGGGLMQEWNDFGLDASMGGGNDYDTIWLGPETYRPSHNSYMVASAWAIAEVAQLAGQSEVADAWQEYGDRQYDRMQNQMYSDELNFWIDVVEGTNFRCEGRELIGYFPYRFGIGTNATNVAGLEAGLTPEHFLTEFGPTTLERSNPYYTALKNSTNCCVWNGQSWPFSTSIYLTTLAQIAKLGVSDVITSELFNQEMNKYTATNYKDGVPYTAESHFPEMDMWSGDTTNHSENYLHSTYMNNVFSDLIGIEPTLDNRLIMQPLIPSNWTYFAVESLPYHGTILSLIWDVDGTHYETGNAGLSIYSNGTVFHQQATLGTVNVTLPFGTADAVHQLASQPEWQNIVANPNSPHGLPYVTADWDWNPDGDLATYNPWKMNDGLLWYDTTPDNRWTNNQSTVPYATINITLPRARQIHSISLAIFADRERGGVVDCPDGIRVDDGNTGQAVAFKKPWTDCVPNALNTVPFADPANIDANETTPDADFVVETDFLQITLSDRLHYTTAVSEIQIWVAPNTGPRYEAEDGLLGTFIGGVVQGRETGTNSTIEDGGVTLGGGAWVELADVRRSDGSAGQTSVTVVGGGQGTVEVQMNWLTNHTVAFDGRARKTVDVDMLRGGNVLTILRTEGEPFIDAIIVES